MATNQLMCLGQYQACALRAVRLDTDCSPLQGVSNGVVTSALITGTAAPQIEEGKRFEPMNACGDICWTATADDRVKRYNVDLELCLWDYELIELLTDAVLVLGVALGPYAGKVIGIENPGPQTVVGNGFSLEIWVRTAGPNGFCGDDASQAPYVRHVLPRVKLQLKDRKFENDAALVMLSGWATENSQWGRGAFDDWPGVGNLGSDTPYAQAWDDTIPTTACGYIDIPIIP